MNVVIVGHVDHGKSTVIGRLLVDTGTIPRGKVEQVKEHCARTSRPFEFAFLLDALKDEQSQGITIDSARVFFRSQKRHYIIIDAPGHIEFLKNMITGASRAEAALLVIDAEEGVQENSRRHGYMLAMLGIKQVAVLVSKMDLVDHAEEVFRRIREEFARFAGEIGLEPAVYIPVSGSEGDNIATRSDNMSWYTGPTALEALDAFTGQEEKEELPFRMPVQDVYKFTGMGDDRRIVAGTIAAGSVNVGDEVVFYPSGKISTVASLEAFPDEHSLRHHPATADAPAPVGAGDAVGARDAVEAGDAVGFTLAEQIYVSRGEIACRTAQTAPQVSRRLRTSVFWLGRKPLVKGKEYLLRAGTTKVRAELEEVTRLIDAASLAAHADATAIGRHDVAECVLRCDEAIAFDPAGEQPETGRFVIIDDYEITGGGIIQEGLPDEQSWVRDKVLLRNIKWERSEIAADRRAQHYGQRPGLVLVTGGADSRKKELAKTLESQLFTEGRFTYYLGIGSVLYGVDADLKGVAEDSLHHFRKEHLRRFAEVTHLFLDAGSILVATAIDLTAGDLDTIKTIVQDSPVLVVWAGDRIATDIPVNYRVPDEENELTVLARLKAEMQDAGMLVGLET